MISDVISTIYVNNNCLHVRQSIKPIIYVSLLMNWDEALAFLALAN